jgi:hypothetical protein
MMLNNGTAQRNDGSRANALANFTGPNSPAAPSSGRQNNEVRKSDPSSAARGDKYPNPAYLDIRTKPRE